MNRIFQYITCAILSVILMGCRVCHGSCPSVEVVESQDSVFIKGLLNLNDSTEIAFAKTFSYHTVTVEDNEDDSATSSGLSIPADMKWVALHVGEDINGYDVDVHFYPDEGFPDVGYARYYFRSGGRLMTAEVGFFWPWYRHTEDENYDYDKLVSGSSLKVVNPFENLVQGDGPEIEECMFCFKDVDFDGEMEICFRSAGYNREYYQICKIIDDRIVPMVKEPYNNIVYGQCGNTVFDYTSGTITVDEEFGVSARWSKVFSRRQDARDRLDPMVMSSGTETNYYFGGYLSRVEIEDGKVISETFEYSSVSDVDCLTAVYLKSDDDVYHLSYIFYHKDKRDVQIFEQQ